MAGPNYLSNARTTIQNDSLLLLYLHLLFKLLHLLISDILRLQHQVLVLLLLDLLQHFQLTKIGFPRHSSTATISICQHI